MAVFRHHVKLGQYLGRGRRDDAEWQRSFAHEQMGDKLMLYLQPESTWSRFGWELSPSEHDIMERLVAHFQAKQAAGRDPWAVSGPPP